MIKEILAAAAILSCGIVFEDANAGLLTNVLSDATREKGEDRYPTAEYNLDTYGLDVRVYEWAPADNPNIRCVFVAGSENSTGVACYPVEKK